MAAVLSWLVALGPYGTQESLAAASTSARWSTDSWLAVSASSITMRARDDVWAGKCTKELFNHILALSADGFDSGSEVAGRAGQCAKVEFRVRGSEVAVARRVRERNAGAQRKGGSLGPWAAGGGARCLGKFRVYDPHLA